MQEMLCDGKDRIYGGHQKSGFVIYLDLHLLLKLFINKIVHISTAN